MIKNPILKKQFQRFREHRRGFISLIILTIVFFVSLFSELVCNEFPYILRYEGKYYFPIVFHYQAEIFGEKVLATVDYRKLANNTNFAKSGNWALFPPIPFGPNESVSDLPSSPPSRPTWKNPLGTDDRGRDLLTRLIYGFRNSMLFALVSWLLIVVVSYAFGAVQGYVGGRLDFFCQRLTEMWNSLPVLYIIIFLISLFSANLFVLTLTWAAFGWIGLSGYVRVEVLRIRKMQYIQAAEALGAGTFRILFRHVLPNALSPILTFTPFIISAAVASLAALDFLGLGLPPPTASWGELLRQGKENLASYWLSFFPFASLFMTLLLLNFVGEAARRAWNVKEEVI